MTPYVPGTELSGTQKAALILLQLDGDTAAAVLSRFSPDEAEDIVAEIVRMRAIDDAMVEGVLQEFHTAAVTPKPRDGLAIATELLTASFGEAANDAVERLSAGGSPSFEFLAAFEPRALLALVEDEMPQVIALVLANLPRDRASDVLAGLPVDLRVPVARAIAGLGQPTQEALAIVAETLKARTEGGAAALVPEEEEEIGGIAPLVDMINRSDVAVEKALLASLDEEDPELAERIRAQMFSFEDLPLLSDRDAQGALRSIDAATLAAVLFEAPTAIIELVQRNISERNRESIAEEAEQLGTPKPEVVEAARGQLVRAVRTLVADGVITIDRNPAPAADADGADSLEGAAVGAEVSAA